MNVAIILAAGESRRMGRPKQLLPFGDKTMIECVIEAFRSPKVDRIVVVLGHSAGEIRSVLEGEPPGEPNGPVARLEPRPPRVQVVVNPNYRDGMFTSVQAGLRALPTRTKLVLIALCDQPRLQRATVEQLVGEFQQGGHKILIPSFRGRQGHPLLLAARYAKELLLMEPSLTLKHFLANHPDDIVRLPVDDEGVLIDIDEPADYQRELGKAKPG